MQFFTGLFGPSLGPALAYAVFLIFIVALAMAAWLVYRAISGPRLAAAKRSRQTRLAITDVALVDKNRRLVLLRRDDVEHLIMIGGHSDLVIESDIRRTVAARPRAAAENKSTIADAAKKKSPPAQPARSNQANTTPVGTSHSTVKPLKLQEETAAHDKLIASSATKTGAAASVVAMSASSARPAVFEAPKPARTGLPMPVNAKAADHDQKVEEMDALLEELAVPKK